MNSYRFIRRLGIDGHAAVTVQWLVRMSAGMVAVEVIQHVVAPTLGITLLTPSQLLDRFLALNHTFPTLGTTPSAESSPFLPPSMTSPLLADIEVVISLLAWSITLCVTVCLLAAFCSWFEYCVAGQGRAAELDRAAEMNRGDR